MLVALLSLSLSQWSAYNTFLCQLSDDYLCRYDPQTNQWLCEVAPTSTCRTSVGVAVLDGYLYAVGGQDGVSCLNVVERWVFLRDSPHHGCLLCANCHLVLYF